MRYTIGAPALLLTGLASAASPPNGNSTTPTDFASAPGKAVITAEAAGGKEVPAAAMIWVQVGSLYGSAEVLLFDQTIPHAHKINSHASSSVLHGSAHHATVSSASCDTSLYFPTAGSAAFPASTARGAIATGSYGFANTTGEMPASQSELANAIVNVTAVDTTTSNTTTFNTTTFNATTSNTTTFNTTTGSPSRGPFPTQLPTGISLSSSGSLPTRNGASKLVVAVLLQLNFVLLL